VVQAFRADCADPCSPSWTWRPGGSLGAQNLDSSPAVANGVLYVGVTVINEPGRLHALDAATGAALADFEVGGLVLSPVIADGAVYVASNLLSGGSLAKFTPAADVTEQIRNLLDRVIREALGPGRSLAAKLRAAKAALEDRRGTTACRILDAFVHEAEARSIADDVIASAGSIRRLLACR
jgi:hypothetical protein